MYELEAELVVLLVTNWKHQTLFLVVYYSKLGYAAEIFHGDCLPQMDFVSFHTFSAF